jgi:hypothetical protein
VAAAIVVLELLGPGAGHLVRGGPASFSPDAFTYEMPDFDAIAQRGADLAIQRLKAGLGPLAAMVQAPRPSSPHRHRPFNLPPSRPTRTPARWR